MTRLSGNQAPPDYIALGPEILAFVIEAFALAIDHHLCRTTFAGNPVLHTLGRLPDAARNLLDIARLRQQAQKLGIRKLESNEKGGVIEFNEKNNVNPVWLIGLLQKQPQHFRLDGPAITTCRATPPRSSSAARSASAASGWSASA